MSFVKVKMHSHYAEVILNRPDLRNAFHPQMIEEITKAFKALSVDKDVRFIVLKGEGKTFCSGADLNWMKSMKDFTQDENLEDAKRLNHMFETIEACEKPVITFVQGYVMGGALGLLAVSDYVYSEKTTQFCFSEVRIGIIPAVISFFVLKKTLSSLSRFYMVSGEMFGANQAQHMGLIHAFGSEEEMSAQWATLKQRLLENGPEAMAATKSLLNEIEKTGLSQTQEVVGKTTSAIAKKRVSPEGQEGLSAFFEKRSPLWVVKDQ